MSYSSEVLADSPFIYLHLNETSGTNAADSSGNGRNGTYNGTVTLNRAGRIHDSGSAAAQLDGSTGYISCPSTGVPTGNASFTQEIWVKLNGTGATGVIIAWGTGNTLQEPNFYVDSSGNLYMSTWNTDTLVQALSVGTWYHLVSTWDGTTHKAYVNGSFVVSSTPGTVATPASPVFTIGRNPSPVEYYANITVQEAAGYATVLSSARITAHYIAGLALLTQVRATFAIQTSLSSRARSTFSIQTGLKTLTRATFSVQTGLKTLIRDTFQIQTALSSQARSSFSVSTALKSAARTTFRISTSLKSLARSTFKIAGNVVVGHPLSAAFSSATRLLATFSEKTRLVARWTEATRLIATFSRSIPMAQPYSLIDVTSTVTENGSAATMSTIAVTVTFPDGSTSNYSLANGDITALGSGQFKLTYTTKAPGPHRELWVFTATDGAVAEYLNVTGVSF
jgi:hypothetical protein